MIFFEFFLFFLISTVYQTLHCQSKLKTCYVLFWSYCGPGVSTKIVTLGDTLMTLCAGWKTSDWNCNIRLPLLIKLICLDFKHKESFKATWTVDVVTLLWTCSKKYLLGGAAFSANLIISGSSLDQCKIILEIRKWCLHLQSFKAT